ncbi:MAG: ADP-ribosylglycohydrolase family protein, partial [Actinomycetota bacterium]|nr:ADP-ribosylglycohydrolase family protein [Actinomycetota bacterium]
MDGDIWRRAAGAIAGAAIGDALGAPFGSLRRDVVPSPVPTFERAWRGHPPGTGTDATAMARNLWRSLIANDGALVLDDVLARHLAWLSTGPSDVGAQTRLALDEAR